MVVERRLVPRRILKGKWRVEAMLGEGGMATVWSGTHRNGHGVAIKALRPGLDEDERICERFLREGYVANRIDHGAGGFEPTLLRLDDELDAEPGIDLRARAGPVSELLRRLCGGRKTALLGIAGARCRGVNSEEAEVEGNLVCP